MCDFAMPRNEENIIRCLMDDIIQNSSSDPSKKRPIYTENCLVKSKKL